MRSRYNDDDDETDLQICRQNRNRLPLSSAISCIPQYSQLFQVQTGDYAWKNIRTKSDYYHVNINAQLSLLRQTRFLPESLSSSYQFKNSLNFTHFFVTSAPK